MEDINAPGLSPRSEGSTRVEAAEGENKGKQALLAK